MEVGLLQSVTPTDIDTHQASRVRCTTPQSGGGCRTSQSDDIDQTVLCKRLGMFQILLSPIPKSLRTDVLHL